MKTFRKWNYKYIEDWGAYCSNDCKAFYRAFKNYLRRAFPNDEVLDFKANHYDASGFIKRGDKYIYISHSINRGKGYVDFNTTGCFDGVLYRTAKYYKDYTGGSNNFCSINELKDCVERLFAREV